MKLCARVGADDIGRECDRLGDPLSRMVKEVIGSIARFITGAVLLSRRLSRRCHSIVCSYRDCYTVADILLGSIKVGGFLFIFPSMFWLWRTDCMNAHNPGFHLSSSQIGGCHEMIFI